MEKLSNKERMKIPRQSMPEQDSVERAHNFKEVNLGFTDRNAGSTTMSSMPKAILRRGMPGRR